ncbi:hypothetical protein EAF04_000767 [Stromatinia cepivora]|nr:hypothetical protein EAF04_000767 [Stromatinia cepivora]
MAMISTTQAHTSLTPPSSSHGQDSWNYSVPAEVEPTSPSAVADYHNHNRQISQTNGHTLHPSTDNFGPHATHDYNHLAPIRANELNRQNSDISDTPSAPDSLLDLYGNNKSGQSMDSGEKRGMNGGNYEMGEVEHSRWIHRDKLARIENEELQAAGIPIPRPRTGSRSSRRDRSQDHGNGIKSEGQKRQKMVANGDGEGSNVWDLRLPEESAGDLGTKGISKIPISKSSPLPIPIDYLERDTPIARKTSNNWYDEEDPLSFKQARSRSHSIKSSLVLDEATTTSNVPMPTPARVSPTPARASPTERSPTKKPPGRKGSIGANAALPGSRQTSAQRQKQKPGGTNAPEIRPKTRSGDLINTSKRPEGDPPWLATMYKPDPRLPPDQQVIPTHAKRMQQEQWEKEGKYGTVYDTSFRPLNQQEHRPAPESFSPPPDAPEEPSPDESAPEWPLTGPQSPTAPSAPSAPASPVSPVSPVFAMTPKSPERAGSYSTMPKIATGKPQGVNIPDPKPPIRVQDSPESKKGCGCCVIM